MDECLEKKINGMGLAQSALLYHEEHHRNMFMKGVKYAVDICNAHNPWHPWPAEKPMDNGPYLVCDDCWNINIAYYNQSIFASAQWTTVASSITPHFWQPLPAPPKEGE